MEAPRLSPERPDPLARDLRLIAARRDPELFDTFYTEDLEDLPRFIARRVGDRERADDFTAEIFLATTRLILQEWRS